MKDKWRQLEHDIRKTFIVKDIKKLLSEMDDVHELSITAVKNDEEIYVFLKLDDSILTEIKFLKYET